MASQFVCMLVAADSDCRNADILNRMPRRVASIVPQRKAEFIEPMECALVPKHPEGSDWTYEVKLDGYRSIGVKTSTEAILYSRNGKNFNKRFPQVTTRPPAPVSRP